MESNIYELMSHFWSMAEEKPFTSSETALYFLLLNRANTQHWQMPVVCPTTTDNYSCPLIKMII